MKKNKYRKLGGGTLRLIDGRKVRANEEFYAYEHEIPTSFADTIELLDGKIEIHEEKVENMSENYTYSIESRGGGYYNVIDTTGNAINEKGLRKDKADKLLKSLL